MTVSPVFFDLTANPGDTLSEKIRIRNNSNFPISIKIEVESISGDSAGNLTLRQDKSNQALNWIKFESEKVVLPPMEWTEVPFTIDVAQSAAYGYYLAVNFTHDKESSLTKTGAAITGAAAVPILLNVRKEGAKAEAKIVNFSLKNFISEYLPADFSVKIQNTGNIHIKPHGNIFISSGNNKNLAILDVNPGLGSVLPSSARIFESSWTGGFIVREPVLDNGQPKLDKNGKPLTHLVFNWNKLTDFRFGEYTATLLMVFDNGTRDVPLEARLSFWVIPYTAIATGIIAVVVIVIIIKLLLSYYINSQVKKRLAANS